MEEEQRWHIGVVLEAFLDRPLDEVMGWVRAAAPEVTHIEVGVGGYAPHPHCDVEALLSSPDVRKEWLESIERQGLSISARNVWGNPLHPERELARCHDEDLRNAILLATLLGVNRVVAMAGCPAAVPGDATPHFAAGGWLPFLESVYDKQWDDAIAPYWSDLAAFARAENPDLLVCLELHPGTSVFNVETFERLAALGPSIAANLDPSHFFWMGMDGHAVARRIGEWVGHVHGKDTMFHSEYLALNGVLDRRWPAPAKLMPWTFAVPGRGHDAAWWAALFEALRDSPATVVSIEHEDPFVSAEEGVPEAATLLLDASGTVGAASYANENSLA